MFVVKGRPPLKLRRSGDDSAAALHAPRSLFDRPTPALIKMRRDLRLQKYRGLAGSIGRTSAFYSSGLPLTSRPQGLVRPTPAAPPPESMPEWLIHEDWALLQVYIFNLLTILRQKSHILLQQHYFS
jgi:hypothetical protein